MTEIHRVRFLNRQPLSLEVTCIPEHIGRRLESTDLVTRDIVLIAVENVWGVPHGHANLSIVSILADDDLVEALRIEDGAPMLRIERHPTHDADGGSDGEQFYFPGDAFQYHFRIDSQHNKGNS